MRIDRIKLAVALARNEMSTVKLAERSGVSRATVSMVKCGKSCTEETARKIAAGLGVDVSELLVEGG